MKRIQLILTLYLVCTCLPGSYAQSYKPQIEVLKMVKADPRLIVRSGYLVVPENRQKANGRKIKIPFVFVRRPEQDAHQHISLYTTGGPGYSTIANIDSISFDSGFLKYGGFIAFDQRGTKKALPCLDCAEVDSAIKHSYKFNLNQDSLVKIAVRKCRNRLTGAGIDLPAYTTVESAEDINDLRLALHIDSLNLVGISYSGGLMLTVARNHPEGVRTLILNSPLPGYVNYEEHALSNINEALNQVFKNCAADSLDQIAYGGLNERFQQYFTSISGKKFRVSYLEKGTRDSIRINYTKNELLAVVVNRLNSAQVKEVPAVINDLISGHQENYIRLLLDDYFSGDRALSLGMRYSVYCTEQIAYANPAIQQQNDSAFPWLSGFRFNNVNQEICACWKVKPEPEIVKTKVFSTIPVLIACGDIDPWCRPFYNRLIKQGMPNTQILIRHNKGHAPGYSVDGLDYVALFLADPFRKIVSHSKDLLIE